MSFIFCIDKTKRVAAKSMHMPVRFQVRVLRRSEYFGYPAQEFPCG